MKSLLIIFVSTVAIVTTATAQPDPETTPSPLPIGCTLGQEIVQETMFKETVEVPCKGIHCDGTPTRNLECNPGAFSQTVTFICQPCSPGPGNCWNIKSCTKSALIQECIHHPDSCDDEGDASSAGNPPHPDANTVSCRIDTGPEVPCNQGGDV